MNAFLPGFEMPAHRCVYQGCPETEYLVMVRYDPVDGGPTLMRHACLEHAAQWMGAQAGAVKVVRRA